MSSLRCLRDQGGVSMDAWTTAGSCVRDDSRVRDINLWDDVAPLNRGFPRGDQLEWRDGVDGLDLGLDDSAAAADRRGRGANDSVVWRSFGGSDGVGLAESASHGGRAWLGMASQRADKGAMRQRQQRRKWWPMAAARGRAATPSHEWRSEHYDFDWPRAVPVQLHSAPKLRTS